MMTTQRPRAIVAAAALATASLVAPSAFAQQFTLQKTNSISLTPVFFASSDTTAGSAFGTVPLSVAFDATTGTAYVGGYHSDSGTLASNSVGIARVDGVLGTSPLASGIAGSTFSVPNSRGIDALDTFAGDIFYAHDSGNALTSRIGRITTAGSPVWTLNQIPDAQRIGALAIDPRGAGGAPTVAFLARGSGRLQGLDPNTGSVLFGPSFSAGGTAPAEGPVVTSTPSVGFTPRALTFDAAGNIAYGTGQVTAGTGGGFAYGNRTGDAQFQNLAGAAGLTGSILKNQLSTNSDNVGNAVAIAEKLNGGTASLLAVAGRIGGDGTIGFAGTFTDSTGGTRPIDSRNVYISNLNGTTTGLTQTILTGAEDGIGAAYTGEAKGLSYGLDAAGNPVLLVLSLADRRLDVYQLEPTWTSSAGGAWGDAGNWRVGLVPNSATLNARFGDSIGATPATVTLNDARTTKNLKFDNAAAGYTVAGTGTLTVDAPDGAAGQITVLAGSHTVAVPVVAAKGTDLRVPAGSSLTLSGGVSGAGITKRDDGTAVVKNFRVSAASVRGGTLRIAPHGGSPNDGVSRAELQLPQASPPAYDGTLDLTNNAVIDPVTPLTDLKTALLSGRAGGAWTGTGITSSTAAANSAVAAVGYASAGDLGVSSFLGQAVSATDSILRYTRLGDANLDGTTGIADFSRLAANFNLPGQWAQGDFNYDDTVGIGDFSLLAANFNLAAPSDASARPGAVPEPTTLGLLTAAALLATRRRR